MFKRIRCDCGKLMFTIYLRDNYKWSPINHSFYCKNCDLIKSIKE